MFCDPSARGAPLEDPPGRAPDKEFRIRNTVWRETNFEGNPGDSSAAADALIDHGLLRVHRRNGEPLTRTVQVRVRELTFREKKYQDDGCRIARHTRQCRGILKPRGEKRAA